MTFERPSYLPINAELIPDELRSRTQWVTWLAEHRGGKWAKVPYSPLDGHRASVSDSGTWGSFFHAVACCEQDGMDGIGFVLSHADPFAGVDLDQCRDVATGVIAPWASGIIEQLDSYTEVSPSGTGVHIIVRGKLPKGGRHAGRIEMYDDGRFLCVTGLSMRPRVEGRQTELEALHAGVFPPNPATSDHCVPSLTPAVGDDDVIQVARSKCGKPFERLWAGDHGGYASQSEADLALCNMLIVCSGDRQQVDRLFRRSGLYRSKWDDLHGAHTYGHLTIAKAFQVPPTKMAKGTEGVHAPEVGPLGRDWPSSWPVLVRMNTVQPESVSWLWRQRVPLGKVTILDGDPDLGKSTVTLDIAARVSTGSLMPDGTASDVEGPAGVVILSAEDGLADTIRPRLDAAGADSGRVLALQAIWEADGTSESERLPTVADLKAIEEGIDQSDAKLVVIDPLMAHIPGNANSNRDQDVRRVLAPVAALAERKGVAVLVVRHLNKSGDSNALYRGGGSIGIIGAARSALLVAKDPDDPQGQRRILASTKSNLSEAPPSLAYHLEPWQGSVRVGWEGHSQHKASALLSVLTVKPEDHGALSEAVDFLTALLADGPRASKDIFDEAKDASISLKTLRRAKEQLGVKAVKLGFNEPWSWELPKVPIGTEDVQP